MYLDCVKLSEWARQQGVSYQTAWRWVKDGKMPVPVRQAPSGTWLVDEVVVQLSGRVVAYCRVSSADQKTDLDRQVARVVAGANGLGLPVAEVVTEVGSGLNGRRRKLHRVLSDPQAGVIVVEHRDRLARFGVEHLEAVLSASGRRLVVLDPTDPTDPTETADDLVRDITEVLTSMCARLYGRRAAKNRAARAVAVATGEAAG
jgi:putative resolvase